MPPDPDTLFRPGYRLKTRTHRARSEEENDPNVPSFLQDNNSRYGIVSGNPRDLGTSPRPVYLPGPNYSSDGSTSDHQPRRVTRPRGRPTGSSIGGGNRIRPRARSISWERTRPKPPQFEDWVPNFVTRNHRDRYHRDSTDEDDGEHRSRPIVHVNPLSAEDVTVHMSVPVRDDLEDVLEECSRLRRLGQFADAIALFRTQLDRFLDKRYVLVQFAQCLYEAGRYDQLEKLAEEKAPRSLGLEKADALQLNWDMLLLAAQKGPYKSQFDRVSYMMLPAIKRVITDTWPKLDSTQCHLLALMPEVGLPLRAAVPPYPASLNDLSRHLLDKGMVWEFRDIIHGELDSFGPEQVLSIVAPFMQPPLHNSTKQNSLEHLRKLWTEGAEDEPTLFALLDTFTTAALQRRRVVRSASKLGKERVDSVMVECMDAADECASALLAIDDAHLMARPCLRWLMAKRMIKDNDELLFFDQLSPGLPDRFNFSPSVFPSDRLPTYDIKGIIPQWTPRQAPPGDDFGSTAQMVLQAAERLGDVDLQTGCLKEMMYRGFLSPEDALSRLRSIWSSTGNQKMLSWLNLFRVLLAHTPSERKELYHDLHLEIETGHRSQVVDRLQVLAALSPDKAAQNAFRKMAEATGTSTWNSSSYDEFYQIIADERRGRGYERRAPNKGTDNMRESTGVQANLSPSRVATDTTKEFVVNEPDNPVLKKTNTGSTNSSGPIVLRLRGNSQDPPDAGDSLEQTDKQEDNRLTDLLQDLHTRTTDPD
ncbi:hypothetical protein VTH82DRAFT_7012 [Thermothelomyces myriococcoides]